MQMFSNFCVILDEHSIKLIEKERERERNMPQNIAHVY